MTAVTTGRLFKCVPQFLIVYPFAAVMTGTVIFLLLWEREPNYPILFTFVAVLGMCEGMWYNITPSMSKFITMIILYFIYNIALVGVLFPTKRIPAFTVIRTSQGVGYIISFIVPLFAAITVSLWIELSLIVIALISYSVILFATHNRKQLFPLCYKEASTVK